MRPLECNICGETTYLLERDGIQMRSASKETPLDHLNRTGHDPRQPPEYERWQCDSCGNVWYYQGDADRPTCPECKGKATQPVAND